MKLLAVAVVAVAFVAGCTGEAPATEPVAPSSNPDVPPPRGNGTADDTASDPLAWVEQAWGGAQEVVLVEDTGEVASMVGLPTGGCVNCFGPFFAPGEGAFVPPGADAVEVTVTWEAPATAPGFALTLYYITASAETEFQPLELTSGQAARIPVAPDDADAPFAARSQWGFFLEPDNDAGSAPPSEVQFRAVARRGPAVPEFAEPPDPWATGDRLVLLAGLTAEEQILLTPEGWFCLGCRNGWNPPGPALVPPGAARLEATLSWTWPGPTKPALHYWNSATFEGAPMTLGEDGATSRAFALDVPEDQVDSPYQRRSAWGFFFQLDGGAADAGAAFGTLTLDAAVVRGAPAAPQPS